MHFTETRNASIKNKRTIAVFVAKYSRMTHTHLGVDENSKATLLIDLVFKKIIARLILALVHLAQAPAGNQPRMNRKWETCKAGRHVCWLAYREGKHAFHVLDTFPVIGQLPFYYIMMSKLMWKMAKHKVGMASALVSPEDKFLRIVNLFRLTLRTANFLVGTSWRKNFFINYEFFLWENFLHLGAFLINATCWKCWTY